MATAANLKMAGIDVAGEYAAGGISKLYREGTLGCGMGVASGGECAGGAIGGAVGEIIAEAIGGGPRDLEEFKNSDEFKEALNEVEDLKRDKGYTNEEAITSVALKYSGAENDYNETGVGYGSGFAQIGSVGVAVLLGQDVGAAQLAARNAAENNEGLSNTSGVEGVLREAQYSMATQNTALYAAMGLAGVGGAGLLTLGAFAAPTVMGYATTAGATIDAGITSASIGAYGYGMQGIDLMNRGANYLQNLGFEMSVGGYQAGQSAMTFAGTQVQRGQEAISRFGETAYRGFETVLYRYPKQAEFVATEGLDFVDSFSGALGGPTTNTVELSTGAVSGKFMGEALDIFFSRPDTYDPLKDFDLDSIPFEIKNPKAYEYILIRERADEPLLKQGEGI